MADTKAAERQESHILIQELKRMEGDPVNIRVLGNWMFSGTLAKVEDELAVLSGVTVLSGGGLTLTTFDLDSITINLEALTSVGRPVLG